ncbi:hypothetical protein FLP10_07605 [Agromyces intestinalis]|uniref:Uncharacterized protein n=1 Tax=Agromyces intestinalis TaxID=2592652 RepID=A0A5C1YGY3_9MICO|nr:hypothetical protein [Agromyces intestinalis]QEO14297.1 hypothetical protein FLP10_07605 [Agromyces intestinalis]
MRSVISTTGRLLAATWPQLLAWYLAGTLARYLMIQLAGFVGASTALGGLLLMPIAILARLVAFVAMLLVLRGGMRRLGTLAPVPADPAAARRSFADAVLAGILPFFAFYAAWGYLREDMAAYLARGLEVQSGRIIESALTGETVDTAATLDNLVFEPITVALIVVAYAGRWALKRYRERLPRWLAVVSVYLEAVWVFLSVTLVSQVLGWVSAWIETRQAIVWIGDARAWVDARLEVVGWLWGGVEWLLGEAGGIVLLPVAWLTIAGVVYGQAVAAQAPRLGGAVVERARDRYSRVPEAVRKRLGDLWSDFASRFTPIGRAIVLMWRAGPVLIGGYVLLYTVVLWLEGALTFAVTRVVGPHDVQAFWLIADTALLLLPVVLVEPIRVALVASAYDATLARLVPADSVGGGAADAEPQESGQGVGVDHVEGEGPGRVVGHEEEGDELERLGSGAGA